MMKKLFVMIAALAVSFSASAIELPNEKGVMTANAHVGLMPGFGLNASLDYTLLDDMGPGHLTVGGFAGFNGSSSVASYNSSTFTFAVLPRVTYGVNFTSELEVHVGAMAGPGFTSSKTRAEAGIKTNSGLQMSCGFVVGGKYFMFGDMGLSAELGYVTDMSYLNLGVTYRF